MNTRETSLVVKSNALIEAMSDMGLQELRFLAFAASRLPHDLVPEKGKPYDMEIDVQSLARTFEMDPKNAYREVKALADKLMRKIIQFDDDEGYEVAVGLISRRKYHHGEGRLWFRFDEELLPHLMGLQGSFTQYRLKDVYQFQRPSTWRVYELLRQYKEPGKREIELEELRWKLGLGNKYDRPIDLNRRVIEPAVEEINSTSDLLVQYEQKKRGRRITALIFHIRDNPNTKTPQEKVRAVAEKLNTGADNDPDFSRLLRDEYRVSPRQARELCKLATMHDAVERLTRLLPKIKSRYEKIPRESRKTSLGGYIFRSLHSELMPKLPLGPDA